MIMELSLLAPTAKALPSNFTGDVYVNPIHRGKEPSTDAYVAEQRLLGDQ
jgi:hypothetical protein